MSPLSLGDLGDLAIGGDDKFFCLEHFQGDYFESLLAVAQEDTNGESPEDSPMKSGGRKRAQKHTERAVKLNRAAQARYRERKKSRMQELESAVNTLQQQLAQLQSQAQEQETRLREAEVQRDMLQLQKESAVLAGTVAPETWWGACGGVVPAQQQEAVEELQAALASKVADLKAYLTSLPTPAAGGSRELAPAVETHLRALMDGVRQTCIRVVRLCRGPDVRRLLGGVQAYKSLSSGWDDPAKWRTIASSLHPSPEQRRELLSCRERVLAELSRILYAERQKANEQALLLLLSGAEDPELLGAVDSPGGASSGLFGFISSFWDRLQVSSQKADVLGDLQKNLEAEQRLILHTEHEVLHKLLTPYQAAVAVTAAFPDHCDALALLNALYELEQQQQQ